MPSADYYPSVHTVYCQLLVWILITAHLTQSSVGECFYFRRICYIVHHPFNFLKPTLLLYHKYSYIHSFNVILQKKALHLYLRLTSFEIMFCSLCLLNRLMHTVCLLYYMILSVSLQTYTIKYTNSITILLSSRS